MLNGNLIHEIGTYKINASMPGMDKPMDDHGKYLTVWEKQKDGSLKNKKLRSGILMLIQWQ